MSQITLQTKLTNDHAKDLYEECLSKLADGKSLEIDISQVKVIKTACIQVLFYLCQECRAKGIEVVISGENEVFYSSLEILGIELR